MKNLEDQINEVVEEYNLASEEDGDSHRYSPVSEWRFVGAFNPEPPQILRIHQLIKSAKLEECFTSPISYIRDYKQWLLTNKE